MTSQVAEILARAAHVPDPRVTDIFTRAIPVVEPPLTGVHLIWTGPPEFIYSPGGWVIERRDHVGPLRAPSVCDVVTATRIINGPEELHLNLGTMVVAPGLWPGPEGGPCLVCTLELLPASGGIHGTITISPAFLYGLRNGKATAFAGPLFGAFDLGAAPLDQLVIYLRDPAIFSANQTLRICRYEYDRDDWSNAKLLAKLQLPIRELMPALTTPDAELAEAKRRLLPGDSIDAGRFHDFMDLIRGIARSPPGAPIERVLLVRSDTTDEFDELCQLDPLRMTQASPLWRRALGFSFFDADPALVVGRSYDYRITGSFPGGTRPAVFGFHTIPSGTALPRDFYLHDCRVRLPAPAVVARAPSIAQTGLRVATRRGIRIEPRPKIPWTDGLLGDFSAVIDLPAPTTSIALSLDPGHQLTVAGGVAWGSFTPPIPVPPGAQPVVTFPQPVRQLRISGAGFLFSILSPGVSFGGGLAPVRTILAPVTLANTPRPAPPTSAQAVSLQAAAHLQTSGSQIPARHILGIDVSWQPAAMPGLTFWPSTATVPPPLEVTSFQIERRIDPSGPWEPVVGGDNLVLGSRNEPPRDPTLRPGVDLMDLFPESGGPRGVSTQFGYRDVFMKGAQGAAAPSPPPPGTMLRYRVGAVDAIGRPSATFTQTDPVRLEKHEPPPMPVAPDQRPADELTSAAPTGVYATVLVRGLQGMTAEETALLGASDNVIVLHWGWHAKQRALDPFATQFRIYLASPLDEVPAKILAATPDATRPGVFQVHLSLDRSVTANAAQGQYLDAGYPFFIETHTGGTDIQATVRTTIPAPDGGFRVPAIGPTTLLVKYSSQLTRTAAWRERLQPAPGQKFVPVTAAETYQVVIRDRLQLSDTHPRDSLWVGVTAADDQAYVADTFTGTNPGGPLPGNESAAAAVLCQGKRLLRPDYQPPPPTGAASRIVAPEPLGAPVQFHLDLAPHLSGAGLPGGSLVFPERLHAVDLLTAFKVQGGQLLALPVNARPNETAQPVTIGNPADRAAIIGAIETGSFEKLDDRFVVLLAHLHPFRDRLFEQVGEYPVAALDFDETLPSTAARYVYRVRKSNSAGALSLDGAVANAVVRVPAPTPGPTPLPETKRATDPAASLRFRIPDSGQLTHLLIFRSVVVGDSPPGAQLLRVPNRPDLHPAGNIRLRLDDNAVLAPEVIALSALEHDARGWSALVEPQSPQTGPVRVWLSTLTADGMPSELSGPWRLPFSVPAPAPPALSASATPAALHFEWTWPSAAKVQAVLERSADGATWLRVSPPLAPDQSSFDTTRTTDPMRYRLQLRTAASQQLVVSNVVII
jgi:hypothetical protein